MIDGKPYLNLDPVSGRCMSCLISWARIAGEKSNGPAPAGCEAGTVAGA
jgi:hypothetical protein